MFVLDSMRIAMTSEAPPLGTTRPSSSHSNTDASLTPLSNDRRSYLTWAIACSLFTVFILAICTIHYIRKRWSSPQYKKKKRIHRERQKKVQEQKDLQNLSQDPIPREDFVKELKRRRRKNILGLEFKALNLAQVRGSTSAAERPQSRPKNATQDALPYDHCRVVLQPRQPSGRHQQYPVESDYINASYVNSMSKKNAYIAAQGPNRKSVSDFWDMIWQENCYCIVMATSLFEHARQQCEKYWHNEHGRYGNTEVWLEHSDLLCDFNVRTFRLRRVDSNEDDRIIKQFQYACWSEHDVPNASALLEFRRRIHVFHRTRTGPIVVHCGNGAGRTGAFIALDAVLEQASVEKNIDIFSYVMYLRSCRQTMVRTPLQYEFIYDCVSMHMQCGSTVIGAKELHHVIPLLSAKTPKTGLSGFETEYRTLEYIVPKLTVGECAGGHRLENRRKSRDVMVQPPERSRPYLITHDSNDSTDYINAVYADGYRNSNAYVVTQWPMRKTVNDIWRLIYDYNIPTLVVLNDCPNSTNYPSFWPVEHAKEVTYGPLTVEFVDQDKSDKHVSSKLFRIKKIETLVSLQAMANGGEESSRLVRMFQIHSWPNSQQVPNDSTAIIDLLSKVEDWQVNQCHGRIPTCVLSRDGISRCGIYLTASIAWEKLKAEGEIDVFNAVKVVKTNRPALIPNLAEYIYCYTFMLVLLEILTATRPNLIPINQMLDDTWEKRDKAVVDPPSGKGDCPTPTPSHLIQKQNDVVLEEEVPQGASAQPMELILCVPEIHASREQLIPEMDSDGHDNPAVDNDDILYCSHL